MITLSVVLGSREGRQALSLVFKNSGAFMRSGNPRQLPHIPSFEDERETDTDTCTPPSYGPEDDDEG